MPATAIAQAWAGRGIAVQGAGGNAPGRNRVPDRANARWVEYYQPQEKSAYHWEVWHLKFYGGGPERNAEWDGMNLDEGSVTMAKWIVKHTKK